MEHVPIAALRPNLDALDSKQIKAVVTLIWPYSSSQRQFALLLAEPDFRLRRRNGQVRARFSSTSARALAATGVGIGDEVVLSLHGAQFVQDGAVSTPGKSIDWELVYTQTVAISVRRDGAEIASLDFINAAPTPAPRSPAKKPTAAAPSPTPQWASPAFLKRARLSGGPFFAQPAYDPLADESYDGHDKKRRRKSYRDWTAWTYTARTPSPEKEDAGSENELEDALSSPSRPPPQLPKTPISPSRTEPASAAAAPADDSEYIEETTIADSAEGDTTVDDGELQKVHAPLGMSPPRPDRARDGAYYQLYDVPNEGLQDSQYDFGGDTELNTEDEDVTVPDAEHVDASTTEAATEIEDEPGKEDESSIAVSSQPVIKSAVTVHLDAASATEEDSDLEVIEADHLEDSSVEAEGTTIDETVPEVIEPAVIVDEPIPAAMPPPTLPALYTDFTINTGMDLLTPIGREPSSPNLRAVDSATLPLPSPFPGEQDVSYFEHVSVQQQAPLDGPPAQEEPEVASDADYIMESSFFSSINSSRAGGLHPDHETAFTPLRFTFGGDGAGWSRPLELSSPPPEANHAEHAVGKDIHASSPSPSLAAVDAEELDGVTIAEQSQAVKDAVELTWDQSREVAATVPVSQVETTKPQPDIAQLPAASADADPAPDSSNVVHLSSDVESNHSEPEDGAMVEPEEEHLSEQETESKVEDEVDSSDKEHEAELEDEEVGSVQATVDDSRLRTVADESVGIDSNASDERQYENTSVDTQAPAAVTDVVDLGPPSASERSKDEEPEVVAQQDTEQAGNDVDAATLQQSIDNARNVNPDDPNHGVDSTDEPMTGTAMEKPDDVLDVEVIQERATVASSGPQSTTREPASIPIPDAYGQPPGVGLDEGEPQLGVHKPLPFIEDHNLHDAQVADTDSQADTEHPDIKMESVEDGSLYLVGQQETQNVPQASVADPATELLISVPEDGSQIGELQSKSVPATAPARNTRSKAKSAASLPEEQGNLSRASTSTRRTRSKASFDSTNRDTTSPTHARGQPMSTVSPIQDAPQTSPYSLRSQSKHMSPDSVASQPAPVRRSPRGLVRRENDFDMVPSQAENRDISGSALGPSQELGFDQSQLSQRAHSDIGFVKDSEEGTSHSGESVPTIRNSDLVEVVDHAQPTTRRLRPPPLSFSQTQRQTRSRSRSRPRSTGQQGTPVTSSQPQFSPRRSPRLTRSTLSATPSPRITRTTRDLVQVTTMDAVDEKRIGEAQDSDHQSTLYPSLPAEGHHDRRSSLDAVSAQQPPQHESNLLTPDDTQQTALEPPVSFQARQPEQSLITPELTQITSTSASLRSFDIALPGVQTQPAPHSPILRTSPRRKSAATNAQSSPTQQSSDAASSPIFDPASTTTQAQVPLPTIGLSTPLAYYTPLRDLPFFLNRSSQFHSGASPDVLALVVSSTTTPVRAKKGPRDYSTTLHVTDPSVYPASRTVTVFRPHATALPEAEKGDVVLLRAFTVLSLKGRPALRSADDSAWCVWRFGKQVWGRKKGVFGELRAREEVKGPQVERGEGEWAEVGRVRGWWTGVVRAEVEAGGDMQQGEREVGDEQVAV
ncbi:3-dehydroshikimate dehydratase [Stagonosporopsis vannaccii]|nr:3-dehydroshikimate dehydratase [Stagonosporopsis vannaccii]